MALMRVTPMYKSKWGWLAILAYFILLLVCIAVFGKVVSGWIGGAACGAVGLYLWHLAKKAQFEQDWEIPQTPRVNIHE